MVVEIHNVISTLFQRRKSFVNPICIFNVFSTSIQRAKVRFARWGPWSMHNKFNSTHDLLKKVDFYPRTNVSRGSLQSL